MSDEETPKPPARHARPAGSKNRILPPLTPEMREEAMRPAEVRAAPREDDSRARAAKRAAELREHNGGGMDEGEDRFYIDPRSIPAGWSYEWKRVALVGKADPAYEVNLSRGGWEPVPASRHPELMPKGDYSTIEIDGMMLYERPLEITEDARNKEKKRARQQVKIKEDQLNEGPPGTFERSNKGAPMAKIQKTIERMEVPKE